MERKMTVHATSGYQYKDTATLQLKGAYLPAFGFNIGDKVSVHLEDRKIIIIPAEKAESEEHKN